MKNHCTQGNSVVRLEERPAWSTRHYAVTALAVLCIYLLTPLMVAADEIFDYTAMVDGIAAQQGSVTAASIMWTCRDSRCTVSGPWPVPGVIACRALAQKVGRIKAYGHPGARLNSTQLNECNSGVSRNDSTLVKNKVADNIRREVPPIEKKEMTPGPIQGPEADTMSRRPQALLRDARPAGYLLNSPDQDRWYCDGNRCTARSSRRFFEPLTGRRALTSCRQVAAIAGPVTWFWDGQSLFDDRLLQRCNSPFVTNMEVLACSGDDDLRRNSNFKIGITITGRRFTLDSYRSLFRHIAANTCQTAAISSVYYPKHYLSELSKLQFHFVSGKTTHADTPDNWDMNRLTVTVWMIDPGGHQYSERIVDLHGDPVKRFSNRMFWHVDINP